MIALIVAKPLVRGSAPVFAIVTLAFSAVVQIVLTNWNAVTGGPAGLRLTRITDHELYYDVLLAIVLFAGIIAWRLRCMPIAIALRAARDDEIGCCSIGINPAALKLSVIAIAGAMAGVAGGFYATALGAVRPAGFDISTTATLFVLVLLGGMRTQLRLCIAALLVIGLPLAVPFIAEYRLLIFGIGIALWPLIRHSIALRFDSAERSVPILPRFGPRPE